MKTTLSPQESANLIAKGISADKASVNCPVDAPYRTSGIYLAPIFTLADILGLLPKKLNGEETDYCDCELHIHAGKLVWSASYMGIRGSEVVVMKFTSYDVELIDALFLLLCKLIDNHVKLD